MADKKFEVGDRVRQTGPSELGFTENMGQVGVIKNIFGDGSFDVHWDNGNGNTRKPESVEHVKRSHAACILTEKVTVGGVPCRKILGFEGIKSKCDLPDDYVNGKPAFYIDDSWAQNVRIFEGHGYEIGDYMEDPVCWLYVPNECEHEVRFEGYNPALSAGCVLKESDFQAWIKWMRRAGSRLAKIRKQKKNAWSGKETIEI